MYPFTGFHTLKFLSPRKRFNKNLRIYSEHKFTNLQIFLAGEGGVLSCTPFSLSAGFVSEQVASGVRKKSYHI